MRSSLLLGLLICAGGLDCSAALAVEPWLRDTASSATTQARAVEGIPFSRMTEKAQENLHAVVGRPSFFRRLPTQTIECDPELYLLVVRYPEIIVNIWELMGITKVEVKRIAPYVFKGQDGAGTACRAELLYGTSDVHVYYGTGAYAGAMAAREIDGRCVCVLHSTNGTSRGGEPTVTVTMDVFMKVDNFGADLLTRTLGSLVGKTADYNFVESAKFVAQLYQLCRDNPAAAQQLALRLNRVDPAVRTKFSQVAAAIAANHPQAVDANELEAMAADVKSLPPTHSTTTPAKPVATVTQTATLPASNKSSRQSSVRASISDNSLAAPARPETHR